jgi:hypothetical protein
MPLNALKPGPGEGGGVAGGCLFSLLLHPLAFIVVAIIGTAINQRDGPLMLALPFLMFVGLAQWIYVAPIAWFIRRWSPAMAKGVVIGGGLLMLLNTLCYGGMAVLGLQNAAQTRQIQQEALAHPMDFISADGIVTVVDDKHFEFRREDGTEVSLLTWEGLDYIFLKKNGGYEKRTRDMLKPGVRVSVDYSQERGKPPVSASIVRVYEEGARR